MVTTLGRDALEEYCRYGQLSEAKVGELEVLEGVLEGAMAENSEGAVAEDCNSEGEATETEDDDF